MVAFYGNLPAPTLKAVTVTLNGVPAGIIGIAREQHASRLFSEYKPELEPYLGSLTVLRAVKLVSRMVEDHPGVVYAVSDREEGRRILKRLGFVEEGSIWRR